MRHVTLESICIVVGVAALSAIAVSCGGSSPAAPSPPPPPAPPTVTDVSPNSGPTLGGTAVTITGTNFAAGAVVSIGGAAASDVAVQNASTITAVTGRRAAGQADVVVTMGTVSGSLPGAYTYVAPEIVANAAPRISNLSARGARKGMPREFADLGEEIGVTAMVQDNETPIDRLQFEWSAEAGTIEGSGPTVRWRAPFTFQTPGQAQLGLTIIEPYETTNDVGLPIMAENRVSGRLVIRIHDSVKEIRDLAVEFLTDFSQQRLSPEQVVRNFTDSCRGKRTELEDVRRNQREYTITAFNIDPAPPVDMTFFAAACRYQNRMADACAYVPVRWDSIKKNDGRREIANGTDQVTALYEDSRWRLCDSDFDGTTTTGLRFKK